MDKRHPETCSRVLILDDDQQQIDSLSATLRGEGCEVVVCGTAMSGIERLGLGDIDVAVIGHHLPDATDDQVLGILAELECDVALIIHWDYDLPPPANSDSTMRSIRYVEKSRDPSDLLHHVYRAAHQRLQKRVAELEAEARDAAGVPIRCIGMQQDITELNLLEEQLRHSHKMEAIGQLASGMAHEFNNLLFGILGTVEVLNATPEAIPAHVQRALQDINECGQRGAALTKQLLAFAKKTTPAVSVFDVNCLINDPKNMLQQMVGESIAIKMELARKLPGVKADKAAVDRAVMNLARNARDAMPDGGSLTIHTDTAVLDEHQLAGHTHARPGTFVKLSLTDTGCGMEPGTIQRVFEPFFSTKPLGKGTGLGLSTAFADVTKRGGVIQVKSRQGDGSTFDIYLPAVTEYQIKASDDVQVDNKGTVEGNETILICDDEDVVLRSAAYLLEAYHYTVLPALGPAEAVMKAESYAGTIDLLLTDLVMPGMNGRELAKKVSEQYPDIKIIFMSGYPDDILEAGLRDEDVDFIQKPPEGDTLVRRIRVTLDASRTKK